MIAIGVVLPLLASISASYSQLVVNVRNSGGDVYRENIEANTTLDTISLEFRKSDGTLVTQFIDGKNEVQMFRVVILPEEELGQTNIQTLCFIQRFAKNEFISSDAMSKLRQKNPSTVRHPEESRPTETYTMDLMLNVAASHVLSSHITNICADATTYARSSDLLLLSQILNRDYAILQTVTRPLPTVNLTSCTELTIDSQQPCLCHYDICIGWYPCGLKYCRGKDSAGRIVNYRCGIKTCSRCRRFEFHVNSKVLCIWDEPEFQFPQPQVERTLDNAQPAELNRTLAASVSTTEIHWNSSSVSKTEPRDGLPAVGDLQPPDRVGVGQTVNANWQVKMDQNAAVDKPSKVDTRRYNVANDENNLKQNALDDDDEDGA